MPPTFDQNLVEVAIPAGSIERMHPEYPPLFLEADAEATLRQRRAMQVVLVETSLIVIGAIISVAITFVDAQPLKNALATSAAVAFLILLIERSLAGKVGSPRGWFEGRSAAEDIKSHMWRYMMRARPFQDPDSDALFFKALHETLKAHGELALNRGEGHVGERQITPYMRLVRSLPASERKACYLTSRLTDQIHYYAARVARDRRAAKQWHALGLAFRAATFGFAGLRLWNGSAGPLAALFVTLAGVVGSWSQLARHDDLAKSYRQAERVLRKLHREMVAAKEESEVEKVVLEAEGALSQEQVVWRLKRV